MLARTLHMHCHAAHATRQARSTYQRPSRQFRLFSMAREQVADTSALKGRFMIPADELKQLQADHGISSAVQLREFLMTLVRPASQLAITPISKFKVGAVGLGTSGAIYVGVNVEFPAAHLNNSIHAEQCLLLNCLQHGERAVRVLAVSEAPCGHCRQFYAEVSQSDAMEFVFGAGQLAKQRESQAGTPSSSTAASMGPKTYKLDDLLPAKFGPMDLCEDGLLFPLLLEDQSNKVRLSEEAQAQAAAAAAEHGGVWAEAVAGAERWAQKAYSPYTHSPSGASIITTSGQVFSGGFVESAAFNPSITPFHAAWVAALTHHVRDYTQISHVVLAELPDAHVQHQELIRALLHRIAPAARVTSLPLQRA